ncbi:MAG: hypothetical protein DMD26_13525 [Gemmatimonadetes bacterium]|nr:MAG: hypothetical protein DMD26_13525 [Gemmatimonadota bacterium]
MTNGPLEGKRDADGKRAPASIHSVQRLTHRRSDSAPPRSDVLVHDAFDGVQRLAVFAHALPPGLR